MGAGRRKARVGYMERVTWKYTLLYVKRITNGNFLHDSGNSNLEGWDGEGVGRDVQLGGDMDKPMADSC